jgi:hypothetical protein
LGAILRTKTSLPLVPYLLMHSTFDTSSGCFKLSLSHNEHVQHGETLIELLFLYTVCVPALVFLGVYLNGLTLRREREREIDDLRASARERERWIARETEKNIMTREA